MAGAWSSFAGFSPDAVDFLAELAENNDREWFTPREADFERLLMWPMEALVVALAERLAARDIPLRQGQVAPLRQGAHWHQTDFTGDGCVSELTWANHPNAAMRLRLADYLGRGWTVERLEPEWALVSRPKAWTKPGRVLINPFYVLYSGRKDRDDRMRLTLSPSGEVLEHKVHTGTMLADGG